MAQPVFMLLEQNVAAMPNVVKVATALWVQLSWYRFGDEECEECDHLASVSNQITCVTKTSLRRGRRRLGVPLIRLVCHSLMSRQLWCPRIGLQLRDT